MLESKPKMVMVSPQEIGQIAWQTSYAHNVASRCTGASFIHLPMHAHLCVAALYIVVVTHKGITLAQNTLSTVHPILPKSLPCHKTLTVSMQRQWYRDINSHRCRTHSSIHVDEKSVAVLTRAEREWSYFKMSQINGDSYGKWATSSQICHGSVPL